MDEKQQAMLSYLLGNGLQQEKRVSHVMKQPDYRMGQARPIRVPTHAELMAEREKAAAAKAGVGTPPASFTPMQWSQLRQAAAQPTEQAKQKPRPAATPREAAAQPGQVQAGPFPSQTRQGAARKVAAPLWEKVKRQ